MTLKEKLFNAVFDNAWEYKHENTIPELEKIADDYAIEFAEWLSMFTQEFEDGDLRYWNKDRWEIKTTKKLLKIFKKEKRL